VLLDFFHLSLAIELPVPNEIPGFGQEIKYLVRAWGNYIAWNQIESCSQGKKASTH